MEMKFLGNAHDVKAIRRHTVQRVPDNLSSGDIIVLSPTGKIRAMPPETRAQRVWCAIDLWMRRKLWR